MKRANIWCGITCIFFLVILFILMPAILSRQEMGITSAAVADLENVSTWTVEYGGEMLVFSGESGEGKYMVHTISTVGLERSFTVPAGPLVCEVRGVPSEGAPIRIRVFQNITEIVDVGFAEVSAGRMLKAMDSAYQYQVYYYPSGNRKASGSHRNGKRDGEWEFYDENGQIVSKGTYVYGKKHGIWMYLDSESGVLVERRYSEDDGKGSLANDECCS